MSDRTSNGQTLSPKHRHAFSLRAKMLLAFGGLFALTYIGVILVELYGIPFTGLRGEYELQQEEVFQHLNLVADLKKERLLRWIEERKADVDVLSADEQLSADVSLLSVAIQEMTDSGLTSDRLWDEVQQLDSYRNLHRLLTRIRTAYPEYECVSICDWLDLTIIASTCDDDLGGFHTAPFHADSQYLVYSQYAYVADVAIDNHTGRHSLHLAGTIRETGTDYAQNGDMLGLLVIQISPDDVFKPMLHTGGGLGETGEVLLVNRDRKILTQLKHPLADGSTASPLEYTIDAAPATLAAKGTEGLITSKDYRGVPVLAAYRHLRISPEIGWGMVAKMDEVEAYAPLKEILRTTYVSGISALILVLSLAALIARKLSCPITNLSRVAEEVEAGNLNARVANTGSDEVGVLGTAFNSMIERIQRWHHELEQQVAVRTEELEATNEHLMGEISERKKAVEALQISEEKLHRSFNDAAIGMSLVGPDSRFLKVNPALCKIVGYEETELLGMTFQDLTHPDDLPTGANALARLLKGETNQAIMEKRYLRKDGKLIWVLISTSLIRDSSGEPMHFIAQTQDITVRKQAEEALKDSEDKFRRIAERAFDVILTADMTSKITYVSPSVERVFGYTPEEMTDRSLIEFIPESEIPHMRETFQVTGAGRIVEGHLSRFRKKDGTIAIVEVNAIPIMKDDEVVGAQGIIRDITETKRLQELESRAQRLETAGQISGQVAHDFNNLLAPLIGYPDMIRDELPDNHPVLEYVNDMEKSAHQIAEINQQLLTLGRRGHYNQEPLNLNEVVKAAVRELEPLPGDLSCETHLSQDLMNIMAGPSQLHRVLANLISNARDAMNDSGQIAIETENFYLDETSLAYGQIPTGEYIRLTVTDTGHGIPDDIAQQIFDPFFTTKTSDKKRGSGLGLSVVDAVVKDHGGYIDLHTVEGEGTSFYLYFPITREAADDLGPECVIGGTETVLVVDDDSVQREVSVKILKRLGYKVNAVDCGEEAIRYLKDNGQDILLLDMIMPVGIDGTETYRRALEINPTQKAIILSGFAESVRVQKAQEMGAGAFIRKPLTRKTLADAVRKGLDREAKVPVH